MFGETWRAWLFVIVLSAIPLVSFAQIIPTIVPCSGVEAQGNLQPCTLCSLVQLAQNILNAAIFLAVFMSALLFAYAGWLYVSNEAIGEQQRAKGLFTDVTVGLVIILGAWLFIDTLMKVLMGNNNYFPWNSICGVGR